MFRLLRSCSLLLLLLLCTSLPAAAQAIEDPGPHPVGWRVFTFTDAIFGQGTITGRIYYPAAAAGEGADADPSGGPFPLVAFQHGWLGAPDGYDELCTHIASWGFVVASTGTETGLFPDHAQFARDTRSFLHRVEAESATPASWLYGMAADGDWGAVGHSMGGGTLHLLIGIEPRIRAIAGLQAADESDPDARAAIAAYTGDALYIAGSSDLIVPQDVVRRWFDRAVLAARDIFHVVQGMGHTGAMDDPGFLDPMPAPEQQRLHRRLVTGFLRAEIRGEENLYAETLGEGIGTEPVSVEAICEEPALWARESASGPGRIVVGICGAPGDQATLAASDTPASVPTPYGELGIDLARSRRLSRTVLGPSGVVETTPSVPAAYSGDTLYFQGLVSVPGAGTLSRTADLVAP